MSEQLPQHVAVIMDGNGRWAEKQCKPRVFGHRRGAEAAREIARASVKAGIPSLTLFAFSTENQGRHRVEVSGLLELLVEALNRVVKGEEDLVKKGVRLKFLGDFSFFNDEIRDRLRKCEEVTSACNRLNLNIALNYGGRWDVANAVCRALQQGELTADSDNETVMRMISGYLQAGPVDLLIRTGGERRISNFLLWQCAYSELYFTDTMWPDFDEEEYAAALAVYTRRARRFGLTDSAGSQTA